MLLGLLLLINLKMHSTQVHANVLFLISAALLGIRWINIITLIGKL